MAKYDWSASDLKFRICVAAVANDVRKMTGLMKQAGKDGPISQQDYEEWPVFKKLQKEKLFQKTFKEIFGIDFNSTLPTKNFNLREVGIFINEFQKRKQQSAGLLEDTLGVKELVATSTEPLKP